MGEGGQTTQAQSLLMFLSPLWPFFHGEGIFMSFFKGAEQVKILERQLYEEKNKSEG